jgi:hypothetical protein
MFACIIYIFFNRVYNKKSQALALSGGGKELYSFIIQRIAPTSNSKRDNKTDITSTVTVDLAFAFAALCMHASG